MTAARQWILTFTCADRGGIVAGVTGELAACGGFILDSQQYADLETGRFFMRVVFTGGGEEFADDVETLRHRLSPVAARFALDWSLTAADECPRVLIAVSKTSHCLNDLLHRWSTGALPVEPVGVVSNHEALRGLAEWHGVQFHHLPVTNLTRAEQEARLLELFRKTRADLLVLARYMQVLSPAFVEAMGTRCINIHHSFLPGFKGAKPYHQAHARGVKLIGATAHFVTRDLDEGPIIEQAADRVDHRAGVDELIAMGRDIEAQVLARAVRWIAERRVLLNGSRTVVFR
ncbi:formyltetrahydrofolate deformylase [Sphingomonas sp.]|uniref:formyltetrahydrofolate deformylase n=1 Tax=Sphingomonas sp. TaxID=28214 RepID=UPI0035BBB1D5